jgi:hypothetical protein
MHQARPEPDEQEHGAGDARPAGIPLHSEDYTSPPARAGFAGVAATRRALSS